MLTGCHGLRPGGGCRAAAVPWIATGTNLGRSGLGHCHVPGPTHHTLSCEGANVTHRDLGALMGRTILTSWGNESYKAQNTRQITSLA